MPRGSLTNDATKLVMSGYFITSWIITLLKINIRGFQRFQRGEFSLALRLCLRLSQRQDESLRSLVFVLVFFLYKSLVEKTSSEYQSGSLLSLVAAMLTSVNCH